METVRTRHRFAALAAVAIFGLIGCEPAPSLDEGTPSQDPLAAARALRATGQYESARALVRSALSKRDLPDPERRELLETARTLDFVAELPESSRERLMEADAVEDSVRTAIVQLEREFGLPLARRQLEIRRGVLGPDALDVADSELAVAQLLVAGGLGDSGEEALAASRRAIAIRSAILGEAHPAVLVARRVELAAIAFLGAPIDSVADEARRLLEQTRAARGERHSEVVEALADVASNQMKLRLNAQAEATFREALRTHDSLVDGSAARRALLLHDLGATRYFQGDVDECRTLMTEADSILSGQPRGGGVLGEVVRGDLIHLLPRSERIPLRERQVRQLESRAPSSFAAKASLDLATDYYYAGRKRDALVAADRALGMLRELDSPNEGYVSEGLRTRGWSASSLGELDVAEESFRDALALAERQHALHDWVPVNLMMALGNVLRRAGKLSEAESVLVRGCERFAVFRSFATDSHQLSSNFMFDSPHHELALVSLQQGRPNDAWRHAEAAASPFLSGELLYLQRRSLSDEDKSRRESILSRLGESHSPEAAPQSPARDHWAQALRDWEAFRVEMSEKHPVPGGMTADLETIQNALKEDQALIGWLDLSFSQPHGYVVRSTGDVAWAECGNVPAGLVEKARDGLRARPLWQSDATLDDASPLREIAQDRLDPLRPFLGGVRHLLVVSAGPLRDIPIETWKVDAGKSVLDEFSVTYVPSASVWAELSSRSEAVTDTPRALLVTREEPSSSTDMLAVDDEAVRSGLEAARNAGLRSFSRSAAALLPELPWSLREIEAVAAVLPGSSILSGEAATEEALAVLAASDSLTAYSILHFATHGVAHPAAAESCAVILRRAAGLEARETDARSRDGFLTAGEIFSQWRLDADLVILSTCDSGLGEHSAYDDYVGLVQALFCRGARSVISSRWNVNDRATSLLMGRFYEEYVRLEGAEASRKSESLARAKRWLRNWRDEEGRTPYDHPYYWAGFMLFGDDG